MQTVFCEGVLVPEGTPPTPAACSKVGVGIYSEFPPSSKSLYNHCASVFRRKTKMVEKLKLAPSSNVDEPSLDRGTPLFIFEKIRQSDGPNYSL